MKKVLITAAVFVAVCAFTVSDVFAFGGRRGARVFVGPRGGVRINAPVGRFNSFGRGVFVQAGPVVVDTRGLFFQPQPRCFFLPDGTIICR